MGTKHRRESQETTIVNRTCDMCGKTGPIGKTVQRVMRAQRGKRKFIWKCKDGC